MIVKTLEMDNRMIIHLYRFAHRNILRGVICLLLLLIINSCSEIPNTGVTGGMRQAVFEYEGSEVTFEFWVPAGYRPGRLYPLVISLQEPNMSADEQENVTGLIEKMPQQPFFILYPRPVDERFGWQFGEEPGKADDINFLFKLINQLTIVWDVDSTRIYLAGLGSGAEFAYHIACRHADQISGAGLVSGRYPAQGTCNPSRPVSIFLVHGTNDRIMPIADQAGYQPVSAVARLWSRSNVCIGEPAPVFLRGSVEITSWSGCKESTEVLLFTIEGGSHTWHREADFDASELLWQFFVTRTRTPIQ
jgi:polyhydroxybutyrate depolymerase